MVISTNNDRSVALYRNPGVEIDLVHIDVSKIKFFDWESKEAFLTCAADFKIAVIELNYKDLDSSQILLNEFVTICNFIVIKSMELTDNINRFIEINDKKNIVYVINGFTNFSPQHCKIDYEMFWMTSTAYPYFHEWNHILRDRINAFTEKDFMFDVLYGFKRTHRLYVKQQLKSYDDRNWFYQGKFFQENNGLPDNLNDDVYWDPEIYRTHNDNYYCVYQGLEKLISQIIPYNIYSRTAYSMVLETNYKNNFSFFTEKITKPIVACRLFIVISGAGYLENLRKLGFRTFESIIDESYDYELDNYKRWQLAIDQAIWLCQQPQKEILKKTIDIVLHNYDHIQKLKQNVCNSYVQKFLLENDFCKNTDKTKDPIK